MAPLFQRRYFVHGKAKTSHGAVEVMLARWSQLDRLKKIGKQVVGLFEPLHGLVRPPEEIDNRLCALARAEHFENSQAF